MSERASRTAASTTAVATRDEVFSIIPPEAEGRWNPVGHNRIVEITENAINDAGFGVVESRFQVSHDGNRMFGTYHLDRLFGPNDGARLTVGCRNSTDKAFAMAFAAGETILICSNGCFFGDMVVSRKHLGDDCDSEFADRIADRIKALPQVVNDATERIDFLRSRKITSANVDHLVCRGVRENVFGRNEAFNVLDEYHAPSFDDQGKGTLWGLHSAATHVFKARAERNPRDFQDRTVRLQNLLLPSDLRAKFAKQFEAALAS